MTKITKTSFIPRNNNFDILIKLLNGKSTVGEYDIPKYTVGASGVSSRVLSHWAKNGILPDGVTDSKGWSKFSAMEMAWLKIVVRLRDFGFSLTKIAKIRKQVMVFNPKNRTYPLFKFYFAITWSSREEVYVVVLADGTADLATHMELELAKRHFPQGKKDLLLVSMRSVLEDMGLNIKKSKFAMPLTEEEVVLITSLAKDSSEIKVIMSNGKIKEIENTTMFSENPNLHEIRQGIKDGREYAEVVLTHQKGDLQSARVKKTTRFK